jgi:hypothetical protein
MSLMDMSQYQGEDRDQVIAGERILRSLGCGFGLMYAQNA